jgi:hypothetical protein
VCTSLIPDACLQTQTRDQCLVQYTDAYIQSLSSAGDAARRNAIVGAVVGAVSGALRLGAGRGGLRRWSGGGCAMRGGSAGCVCIL